MMVGVLTRRWYAIISKIVTEGRMKVKTNVQIKNVCYFLFVDGALIHTLKLLICKICIMIENVRQYCNYQKERSRLTFSKIRFSRKENLKKCTSFEEQKNTRNIPGNVYFGIIVFSYLSSTEPCLRFLLIYFAWEVKGLYQSYSGNEVDFKDIMNVSPNILAKN